MLPHAIELDESDSLTIIAESGEFGSYTHNGSRQSDFDPSDHSAFLDEIDSRLGWSEPEELKPASIPNAAAAAGAIVWLIRYLIGRKFKPCASLVRLFALTLRVDPGTRPPNLRSLQAIADAVGVTKQGISAALHKLQDESGVFLAMRSPQSIETFRLVTKRWWASKRLNGQTETR